MMIRRLFIGLGAGLFAMGSTILSACTEDGPPEPGGSSGSSGASSGSSGTSSGSSGAATLNGCTTFADHSAISDARVLKWGFSIDSSPDRCTQIKVGQKIRFEADDAAGAIGDFTNHPPTPLGGDTPNPFAKFDASTGVVTFAAAGTFGFACDNHPSMLGVIRVTP